MSQTLLNTQGIFLMGWRAKIKEYQILVTIKTGSRGGRYNLLSPFVYISIIVF